LPGHGIGGALGALLILTSVIMAFGIGAWKIGVVTMAVSLVASILLFILLLRWLPRSSLISRLAFAGAQSTAEGYVAAPTLSHLTGKFGVAESMLRPAGVATIEGTRYDVLTEGDFIPPQTKIVVETVNGNKIFVKRA
jgi:membrane-bound serine protease (ClpP class)